GDLVLTLTQRGAVDSADVSPLAWRSGKRGKGATTIRWVIDDGTAGKKGDKPAELGGSALQEAPRERKRGRHEDPPPPLPAGQHLDLTGGPGEGEEKAAEVALRIAELARDRPVADANEKKLLALKVEQARLGVEKAKLASTAALLDGEAQRDAREAAARQEE